MEKHLLSDSRLGKGEMSGNSKQISDLLITPLRLPHKKITQKRLSFKGNKGNEAWIDFSQPYLPMPVHRGRFIGNK